MTKSTGTDACKPVDSDGNVARVRERLTMSLTDEESEWLDDASVRRYLRARRGVLDAAAAGIQATLQWRRDMCPGRGTLAEWDPELSTGRMYVAGNDGAGRAVMVTRKRADRIHPGEHERYLRFFLWTLEAAVCCMQQGSEQWVWLLDLAGYSSANSPPVSVSRRTMAALSHHHPERLGKAYIVDAPTVFWLLFNALWPFIDAATRGKVHFVYTKDYDQDGRLRSGRADPTGFDAYWGFHTRQYDKGECIALLREHGLGS